MHAPVDALCCCKPAQPAYRLEQLRRRGLPRVLGETSQDPLAVDLAPNSGERESPDDLGASKAVALELEASEPPPSTPPSRPATPSPLRDRKSTRLNSSHLGISYAISFL